MGVGISYYFSSTEMNARQMDEADKDDKDGCVYLLWLAAKITLPN